MNKKPIKKKGKKANKTSKHVKSQKSKKGKIYGDPMVELNA
jgi:hypothetical protein